MQQGAVKVAIFSTPRTAGCWIFSFFGY